MKVESISFPPLSSGILGFPVSACAKSFFEGVMEFLDKDIYTSVKKLNIVVIEDEKHKEFLAEWSKLYIQRFGNDDDPGSDEHSAEEISDDSNEEEVKKPVKNVGFKNPKGVTKIIDSSDSDSDKKETKPKAAGKTNTKYLDSSDDDSPKNKPPVKKKFSDDSDSDSDPKPATKQVDRKKKQTKTAMLDSDSSDEPKKTSVKKGTKKAQFSDSSSDSDSKPAAKKSVAKKKQSKVISSSSDDS